MKHITLLADGEEIASGDMAIERADEIAQMVRDRHYTVQEYPKQVLVDGKPVVVSGPDEEDALAPVAEPAPIEPIDPVPAPPPVTPAPGLSPETV